MLRTIQRSSLVFAILLALSAVATAQVTPAIDANIHAAYYIDSAAQNLGLQVCGATQLGSGCYGVGQLGSFLRVGAMIEGNPSYIGTDTVIRRIYVVDVGGPNAILYAYKRTDVITPDLDTVSVILTRTVPLPIAGGPTAHCFMAATSNYLFIATDQSPQALILAKATLGIKVLPGSDPPNNVASITADKRGYVTVTYGSGINGATYIFNAFGQTVEDGGGRLFMLNTVQAATPTSVPSLDQPRSAPRIYRPAP